MSFGDLHIITTPDIEGSNEISSLRHPTRGGPPAWVLSGGQQSLTIKLERYEMLHWARTFVDSFERAHTILVSNLAWRPLGRSWRRCKDNFKMDHTEIRHDSVSWIHLPRDSQTNPSHKVAITNYYAPLQWRSSVTEPVR
jgi:hypothetical protein